MKRKEASIMYCNRCRITTAHAVVGDAHTCTRCGAVKVVQRVTQRRESGRSATAEPGHWN